MSSWTQLFTRIAQLAARQWGHVTREQLLALGVTSADINYRVKNGMLIPVYRGVYALSYRRVEPVARAMAAVLAAGPGAVLSHDSALALWALRRWPAVLEVIAPRLVRRPGIVAHRSATLTPAERTVQLGVPVTRPARAISDMGRRLTAKQRTRLANQGRLGSIITLDEFHALTGHRRNPSRSGLEDDGHAWLHRAGFTGWVTNHDVNGYEVDVYFFAERVIVEFDELATHLDTFESDRERDAHHLDHDVVTVRLIKGRLTDAEAARLRRILQRRADGRP